MPHHSGVGVQAPPVRLGAREGAVGPGLAPRAAGHLGSGALRLSLSAAVNPPHLIWTLPRTRRRLLWHFRNSCGGHWVSSSAAAVRPSALPARQAYHAGEGARDAGQVQRRRGAPDGGAAGGRHAAGAACCARVPAVSYLRSRRWPTGASKMNGRSLRFQTTYVEIFHSL